MKAQPRPERVLSADSVDDLLTSLESPDGRPARVDRTLVSTPTVSLVIPARNEAENLKQILPRVPEWIHELIVVDGHSSDGTEDVARAGWLDVKIVRQVGTGKGDALRQGFAIATGDIIVMLDADGSTDPAEIPRFIAGLRTGADLAKGTRFVIGGGSSDITRVRNWGNWLLTRLVNVLWKSKLTDLCYGYIAFWRDVLEEVDPQCRGFEVETLLTIRALSAGLVIVEVPSHEAARVNGLSQLRPLPDGMRVLRTIIAEWIRPL